MPTCSIAEEASFVHDATGTIGEAKYFQGADFGGNVN
jgi:hypothetical protein